MKKILVISQYYYPEQFGINDITKELVKRGYDVTVLTGRPNYPKGELFDGYRDVPVTLEEINGVHVIRCQIRPRKQGLFNLILNYLSYKRLATKAIMKMDDTFDFVYSYQLSPIISVLPAVKYAKKQHKKHFLYCLDVYPESGSRYTKKIPFAYAWMKRLSKKIYNSADLVGVTSSSFATYLHDTIGLPLEKIRYIPQHSDEKLLHEDLQASDNGVVDFMFAGNIGKGARLSTLVEAAALIKEKYAFKVHIVGDGSYLNTLKIMVDEKGLNDHFVFYGYQKSDQMSSFYRMADVLYISLRKNNLTMPGKFQTYLSTGKPIIGAIDGSVCEMMDKLNCGHYAPAEDAQTLSKIMEKYITGEYKLGIREDVKKYFADNFSLSVHMNSLTSAFEELEST